ncbi:MAG: hypothetical protein GX326_00980 [Clostridiaceae bacterium]|nr:hypothetical protein [Clostridiaceae bacterium]
MNKKTIKKAKKTALGMQKNMGGIIFAFPIDEDDPFSKFVLVVDVGTKFDVFPELFDITEVANGILEMINIFKRNGIEVLYERDVRFAFYEAQKNAPSITMKKLRDINNFM